MKSRTGLMAIGLMALASATQAGNPPASLVMIPPQINYQGRLMTAANAAYVDTTHTIDLSLYPTASGGAKIWSERYSVQTRDGYFSVNLGSGGTPLLASNNLPIWQVLWKNLSDANSPDTYFMALTVRTDQNGSPVPTPAEATPRQQFLTAPFAYRAHQSVYASKADGLFSAPQGVQTPTLSSTTNEIAVNAPLRGSTIYANTVRAHGDSPSQRILSSGGPLSLGVSYATPPFFGVLDHASDIYIGAQPNSLFAVGGSDIQLDGKSVDIGTTNFTYNNKPLFVRKAVSVSANTGSSLTAVNHGISTTDYDIAIIGWYYSGSSPGVRAVYAFPTSASAFVYFTSIPAGGSLTIHFLGIRKGLTDNL